jgi:hypothetical protein
MMQRRIAGLVLGIVALASMVQPAQAQSGERCFPETGQCISGRLREYWEQNGALLVFGFPIGPQQAMTIEGQAIQAQPFERNRLELHPENARPYDVLLGRLGADRLAAQGRDWFAFPKSGNQPNCRYFAETDQSVCGEILAAWRANGLELDGRRGKTDAESLALWGLPLSGVLTETLSDGKQYQVQWFERARFELHPENTPPYNVLFGLLGNELATGSTPLLPTEPQITLPPVELVLRLEELSPGFAVDRARAYSLEEAAQTYSDPAAALVEFQQQGRDASFLIEFSRPLSRESLAAGPVVVFSQVASYRDAAGAQRGLEYLIANDIAAEGWQQISVPTLGDTARGLQRLDSSGGFEFAAFQIVVQRHNTVAVTSVLGLQSSTSAEHAIRLAEIVAKRIG